MTKEGCAFCNPKLARSEHLSPYGIDIEHEDPNFFPAIQTDNFIAKPDCLPADPRGLHFLVYPYAMHMLDIVRHPEYFDEIGGAVSQLSTLVGDRVVVMGHGDVDENHGTIMSVKHLHHHVFPRQGIDWIEAMADQLKKDGVPYKLVDGGSQNYAKILQRLFQGLPYIFVQDGRELLYAVDNGRMKSQTVQRLAQALLNGGQTFNWKELGSNQEYQKLSAQRLMSLIDFCTQRR